MLADHGEDRRRALSTSICRYQWRSSGGACQFGLARDRGLARQLLRELRRLTLVVERLAWMAYGSGHWLRIDDYRWWLRAGV